MRTFVGFIVFMSTLAAFISVGWFVGGLPGVVPTHIYSWPLRILLGLLATLFGGLFSAGICVGTFAASKGIGEAIYPRVQKATPVEAKPEDTLPRPVQ